MPDTPEQFARRIEAAIGDLRSPEAASHLIREALGEGESRSDRLRRIEEWQALVKHRSKALKLVADVVRIYGKGLTPESALRLRDRLAEPIAYTMEKKIEEEGLHNPAPRGLVLSEMYRAPIVIWRADILRAALKGHESFIGRTPEQEIPDGFVPGQWWFIDNPAPNGWTANCTRFGFFLVGNSGKGASPVERGLACLQMALEYGRGEENEQGNEQIVHDASDPKEVVNLALTCKNMGHALWDKPIDGNHSEVLAAIRFMGMEWVGSDRAVLPRHLRRQAEQGRRPPLPEIKTITLRRACYDDREKTGPGEHREYSCSFLVNAYWRRPSPLYKEQKPVYVREHVKGNPDKPFREPKATIYTVRR